MKADCERPSFRKAQAEQTTVTIYFASCCVNSYAPWSPPAARKPRPHLWTRVRPRILRILEFVIQGKFPETRHQTGCRPPLKSAAKDGIRSAVRGSSTSLKRSREQRFAFVQRRELLSWGEVED